MSNNTVSRGALLVRYGDVWEFDNNGIAVAELHNGLMCHIDRNGDPLYKEKYLTVDLFFEGFAVVQGKKGFRHIRPDGTSLYPERYKVATRFHDGVAIVVNEGFQCWHIGLDGKRLYEKPFQHVYEFMNGVALAQRAGKWILIDKNGQRVGDEEFDDIQIPGIIIHPLKPFARKAGRMFRINLDGTRV